MRKFLVCVDYIGYSVSHYLCEVPSQYVDRFIDANGEDSTCYKLKGGIRGENSAYMVLSLIIEFDYSLLVEVPSVEWATKLQGGEEITDDTTLIVIRKHEGVNYD